MPVTAAKPPEPPPEFGEKPAAVWRQIVSSVPNGWFSFDTHLLLERLCCLIVWARRLEQDLAANDYRFANSLDENNYVEMHKTIGAFCTKLRLTVQSHREMTGRKAGRRIRNFTVEKETPWGTA